jgi:hypothetical protein
MLRKLPAIGVAIALGALGLALFLGNSSPASAATVSVGQCNGVNDTPGLTTTCQLVIVNNLTNDPATTGSTVALNGGSPTTSSNLVTSVTQCNGSGNGGGGTLTCSVLITNNISVTGPSPATSATVDQCVGSGGPPGYPLGPPEPGNPDPCNPYPATTTSATITQCNGSASGGGLVAPSACDASGTVSSTLPVSVNQCNGSVNGGGSTINCSVSLTANVINVGAVGTTTTTTTGTGGTTGTTASGGTTTATTAPGGTSGTTTPDGTTTATTAAALVGTTATTVPAGVTTAAALVGTTATTAAAGGTGDLALTGLNVARLFFGGVGLLGLGLSMLGAVSIQKRRRNSVA